MIIDNSSLDEWLAPLKKYQQDTFKQLVDEHGVEEAAKLWLSAQGPKSTVGFGGASNPQPFHDRFIEEFRKFICGDPIYNDVRQKLGVESPIVKGVCISTISTALGAAIGFTATLLAPAVAAMLYLVGQMGINAWCEVS